MSGKYEKRELMKSEKLKNSFKKAGKNLLNLFPLVISIILLISLLKAIIPISFYTNIFQNNIFIDSFIGAIIGSLSFGSPITSYIIGGELLNAGISLIAVTAFILAWVSVGIIQLPVEIASLGKKFALIRNLLCFIFSIIIAIIIFFIISGI